MAPFVSYHAVLRTICSHAVWDLSRVYGLACLDMYCMYVVVTGM
jgi:hypothetical protein